MARRVLLPLLLAISVTITLGSASAAASATEKMLHSFEPYLHGAFPTAILPDAEGNLYVASGGGAYNTGMLSKLTPSARGDWNQTVLYTFTGGTDGGGPISLILDATGNLYGLTDGGGAYGFGTFFQLTPSSGGTWQETVLYSFTNQTYGFLNHDLNRDSAGNFYGTTNNSPGSNYGSLFQLTRSSSGVWTENVIHAFSGGSDGGLPYGVTLDSEGNLYGTAEGGGPGNFGLVWEFIPSGGSWREKVLYNFVGGNDGSGPGGVVFDQGGNLYGSTAGGGNGAGCGGFDGCGIVYELKPSAGGQWTEVILYTFNTHDNGPVDSSALVMDSAGNLYGTTYYGGNDNLCGDGCGTVFEVSPAGGGKWTATVLHSFTGGTDGYNPYPGVVVGGSDRLFGAVGNYTAGLINTIFQIRPNGTRSTFDAIYRFRYTDGASPQTNLIADSSGNLYGTANLAGTDDSGAVFQLTPQADGGWKETLLYGFISSDPNLDYGVNPSSLILDSSGNLYGTAELTGPRQYGSVFELSPITGGGWKEQDLFHFSSFEHPLGSLVFDRAGNLYGTSYDGGGNGIGSVYELTPGANGQWTEKTVYSFAGYPGDGAGPEAGMIMDKAGNLYGTTQRGGNGGSCLGPNGDPAGCGTVFELSPAAGGGWTEQILYSFQGATLDGAFPVASLIFDAAGNLYGTTQLGGIKAGCNSLNRVYGCGTVFELSPDGSGGWSEKVLYEFKTASEDGYTPIGPLVFDRAGNLYGTTLIGGAFNYGTLFKLTPGSGGWTESIVHSFGIGFDGKSPCAGLIVDAAGNLYGTTAAGGKSLYGNPDFGDGGFGMVFEITP